MRTKKNRTQRLNKLTERGQGAGNSAYAQKVKSGRQIYGDGRSCCGHRFNRATRSRHE